MTEGNCLVSPSFLKAENAQALERLMLENNIKHNTSFNYFSVTFAQNDWYAFYYINQELKLKENIKNNKTKKKK